MKSLVCRLLLFIYILPLVALGQSDTASRIKRVENGLLGSVLIKGNAPWAIEERMRRYRAPGVSVAVINDFKVEWAKAYGVKDVETKEVVTTETLFQAGSISKPVAAMVALKKVEEGKISLDQNINDKLTTWKLPENQFTAKKKVTLANLLSHTGGLTVHGFPGYAVGAQLPTLPQVLDGSAPANTAPVRVDMEPGTKFRYSGGGTTIAQLAIMDIEKKPYPQIVKETVLDPLKMTNSTYSQPLPDDWRKRVASGHRAAGLPVEGKIHIYPEMAAAGLWTTPTDLAKFGIEVQLSLQGKSNKVLSKQMIEKMVTPFIEDQIALGFFLEKHGQAMYFGHGGADEGFRAGLLLHKDKGYGVAVMVNSDNGEVINEIFRAVASEYNWEDFLPQPYEVLSVDSARLDTYTGRFQIFADRVLTFTNESGKLFMEPTLSPKVEMLPIAEDAFIRKDQDIRYTFVKGADGKVETVKVQGTGVGAVAKRISKETLIPYELLVAGRTAEATEAYKKIKKEKPNDPGVDEARLNNVGYTLLREKKFSEAIAIFKINVELYPQSFNVYDSLAEAYMMSGEKELAIANYKKSLELNPKNTGAVEMLKKLQVN
jgi:CubicO group peptidase (beta-lactamase class C family)